MSLLEVRDLAVSYATDGVPVPAIDGVGFDLDSGEVVGVAGASGSGKTTLALSLLGLLPEAASVRRGRAIFRGRDLLALPEAALEPLRGAELAVVFQEPGVALNPVLRVGDQVAEVIRAHRGGDAERCRAEARAAMARVGLPDPDRLYHAYPHELSHGQRQRVTIAQAVSRGPALLVADEPTSGLDATTRAEILSLIADLRQRLGLAVLLVSHDLGVLGSIADRLLVMYGGRVVEEGRFADVCRAPMHPHTRALLASRPGSSGAVRSKGTRRDGSVAPTASVELVRVSGLRKRYVRRRGAGPVQAVQALEGVDLTLAAGSTLALVGPSGSGKSTLARCLAGLEAPDGGDIRLNGRSIVGLAAREQRAVRTQVQLIFQDSATALPPRLTAAEIVEEPLVILRRGTGPERRRRVHALFERVGLAASLERRRPFELSGGQRQRLAIARALAVEPKLLVLDEAQAGLDAESQAQIVDLLSKLQAASAVGYLLVSHDLGLVAAVADEVAVLHEGRIVERGEVAAVLEAPQHAVTRALVAAIPAWPA